MGRLRFRGAGRTGPAAHRRRRRGDRGGVVPPRCAAAAHGADRATARPVRHRPVRRLPGGTHLVPDVAPHPDLASVSDPVPVPGAGAGAAAAPRPNGSEICAVVLAAGEGRRLRPLTRDTPKALCPVGNVPLLERALAAVASLGFVGPDAVAVNAWYRSDQIVRAVDSRAHVSLETGDAPLGSGGGLGALNGWVAGRHVLVGNADAYLDGGDLTPMLDAWAGDHVRILGVPAGRRRAEFGPYRFAGFSLLPAGRVAALAAEPGDLVRAVWRPAEAAGELRVGDYGGTYIDSGTAADYLAANVHEALP